MKSIGLVPQADELNVRSSDRERMGQSTWRDKKFERPRAKIGTVQQF